MNSIPQGESFTSRPTPVRWDKFYMGLKEFTAARLAELDRNPFEAARIGKLERTFVRDILIDRKKTVLGGNLAKLAVALDTTPEAIATAIAGARAAGAVPEERVPARRPADDFLVASPAPDLTPLPHKLPVFKTATADKGSAKKPIDDGFVVETDKPIDFLGRPPSLAGVTDAYVIYVIGESMKPKIDPGEPRVVHPHRPYRAGDVVVLQVRESEDGPLRRYLKIFHGRTGDWIAASQLNPPETMRFRASTVIAIHKVLTMADVLGAPG